MVPGSLSKVLSSLGGLGLSFGAEAAVSRLREAVGLSETGLLLEAGLEEDLDVSLFQSLLRWNIMILKHRNFRKHVNITLNCAMLSRV